MNPALRTNASYRLRAGHGRFGFFDSIHRVHDRPSQSHHDVVSVRHFPISDAGHNAVSGGMLRETIDINLRRGKWLAEVVFRHDEISDGEKLTYDRFAMGAEPESQPSRANYFSACDGITLDLPMNTGVTA
jgi:hypothetical protein